MNREHPLVVFTWQYASREQLAQLGVLPGAGARPLYPLAALAIARTR